MFVPAIDGGVYDLQTTSSSSPNACSKIDDNVDKYDYNYEKNNWVDNGKDGDKFYSKPWRPKLAAPSSLRSRTISKHKNIVHDHSSKSAQMKFNGAIVVTGPLKICNRDAKVAYAHDTLQKSSRSAGGDGKMTVQSQDSAIEIPSPPEDDFLSNFRRRPRPERPSILSNTTRPQAKFRLEISKSSVARMYEKAPTTIDSSDSLQFHADIHIEEQENLSPDLSY